jgi:hypothetical protein
MEVPLYQQLFGTGTFSASEVNFTSEFLLLRNPRWMGVLAIIESQAEALRVLMSNPVIWQFRGTLQDGRPIQSDSLLDTGPTESPYNIGFSVMKSVHIGKPLNEPPLSSEFPLVNYFEGPASLSHRGWELVISEGPTAKRAESLAKQWQLPFEGVTLKLTCPQSTPEDHEKMAILVMTLASLALGTGVSSHRNILYGKSTAFETWRFMTGDEIGPGLVIPSQKIGTFLAVALPAFESLTPEKQARVRLGITYINLSEGGYLDTRLLTILQAWEFLSLAWVDKQPLPPGLLCLRSRITKMLKDWRQDHVTSDSDGFWGSRLVSVLDWTRLNNQLQDFAAMWEVDLERIGVDLAILREMRNNVAHEGELPEELSANSEGRYNLLRNARHALRLVLLRMLGYRDLVVVNKGGWKGFAPMEEALAGEYGAV